jgi:hypothetical protein
MDSLKLWAGTYSTSAEAVDGATLFFIHGSSLGDRVLALGTLRTVGRGSGIEQEISVAFLVTYRDGLCTHLKDYGEWGQALEAAGLSQ